MPRWTTVVDLEALPSALIAPTRQGEPSCRYLAVRVLVRFHGAALGIVECPLVDGVLSGERLRRAIDGELADARARHEAVCPGPDACVAWGPALAVLPSVSVVVSTRERPELLADCLKSLCALEYPTYEVIVADNAPETTRTRELVEGWRDDRVRYVCTSTQGPSAAKNHGVAHSDADVVAFTDDDVVVDPRWLLGLVRGFGRRISVGVVTGVLLAAELESEPQALFERAVTWGASLEPRVVALDSPPSDDPLFPFNAGSLGAGASFAVRRTTFHELGGFDEALGPGTPTRSAEDIDFFLRALLSGHAIAYEPASLAWHRHRRDVSSLTGQLTGYGTGLTAYAFKYALERDTRNDVLRRALGALRHLVATGGRRDQTDDPRFPDAGPLPRGTRWKLRRSMARGPGAYLRARAAARRPHADVGSEGGPSARDARVDASESDATHYVADA